MEVTEDLWWKTFEKYGEKFAEAKPNYNNLDEKIQEIGALFQYELDIYNGGFLQAFCNWGYNSYLLEIKALEKIGANNSKRILEECYSVIVKLENDDRLKELWDIPKYLTIEDEEKLNSLDEEYWEDEDNIMEKMYNFYIK
ncbi:MAG: DMP19 family protein [Fusobacterium perfoetens]|uniref:DMP19 family protein n=1 Tax=Fusobacterium perfoetens TaxID=852 RepID=UPI0023EF6D6C|nr:DUF4375 domain-containing protein [Fusobacterium perfoetens]MCI6152257.1 DMP19 family protein [Fusobacterium perfoetens]MDY3238115.1 DUF4375 domain-containing protein [Fusobacterium perfoetens]